MNDSLHTIETAGQRITRREAIRKAVIFSSGMLAAGRLGRLNAAPPATSFADDGLHLLAFGDFGSKGDAHQVAVARQMANFADALGSPLAAVLALGDNFYRELSPERFDAHFERMYSDKSLNCPFYVCVGNHDYGAAMYDAQEGKLQMELDYAKNNPDSRWKLPAKWYAVELPSPETPLVKLIVLDGNYWAGALTPQEKIAQRRFLEAELAKPLNAKWLWVVSHFPMFSQCTKRGDNAQLINEWGPHFKAHPVSLYLAGHDHNLQHLRVEGYDASFVVSGAGGASSYEVTPSPRGYVTDVHGFNHIHVTPEQFDVQFINAEGDCLHAFRRTRDGKIEVTAGI